MAELVVRDLTLEEIDMPIDYFLEASNSDLIRMGVDQGRLPGKADWQQRFEGDLALPIRQRERHVVVWERDAVPVGFSTTNKIVFGVEAYMHLHILDPGNRRRGMGAEFVKLSAQRFFALFDLERLYCEPNAFNVAPHRTVQSAGFRFVSTQETLPGDINYFQTTNRWVLDREDSAQ